MQVKRTEDFVHIIGCDFDDCLLTDSSDDNLPILERNQSLLAIWNRQNARAYAATFFYSSSNRQSWAIDDSNRKHPDKPLPEDPSSSFLPFKAIAEQGVECTFWSCLLADVYSENPFGYSYARALSRAWDDTAWHPGCVFDESKFSLIYAQAHLAANNMRTCDFLTLESVPETNWMQLPFKSNAAYIYIESKNLLFYLNKAEHQLKQLVIKNPTVLFQMLAARKERISEMEHDFQVFYQNDTLVQGITLSDEGLKQMKFASGHLHKKKDRLIVFDFYDDRLDILRLLGEAYKTSPDFLPANLILRLNLYTAKNPQNIHEHFAIVGKGSIDIRPGESVINMAKLVLGKTELDTDDFLKSHSFSHFRKKIASDKDFNTRSLVIPGISQEKENTNFAPHSQYTCVLLPQEIALIRQFIIDKKTLSFWDEFFSVNSGKKTSVSPIIRFLKTLLTVQTEDRATETVSRIFSQPYQNEYNKIITENSDMDVLLRKMHANFLDKVKEDSPLSELFTFSVDNSVKIRG